MKIQNLNISNEFIHYKNVSLNFDSPGIYLLLGPNGSGKTTFLENIVFGKLDASFSEPEMERYYYYHRHRLFAYVQQNIADCDLSVRNYILKDNPEADWQKAKVLLSELDFEKNNFKSKVQTLSGGERVKAAFVSAIIKNTPYIFLDEPTNYLDDTTVKCMIRIIQEHAISRVIVIATHDERLMNLDATRYYLDGSTVRFEENNTSGSKSMVFNDNFADPPIGKIVLTRINRPLNYFIWLLTLIVAFCISYFLQLSYLINYDDELVPTQDLIAIYSVDRVFDTLNQKYCSDSNISINESSKYSMIYIDDIPDIAMIDGCEDIYILDYPKLNEFMGQLAQQSVDDQLTEAGTAELNMDLYGFAIPESLYQDQRYLEVLGLSDFMYLDEGRLPKDGAKEVSVSRRVLQKYFDFSESETQDALGKTLVYQNEQYQIVGILYIDVCLFSYSDSMENTCFYHYSPSTFSAFSDYYISYLEDNGFLYKNVESLVVVSQPGYEKNILNQLIKKFPANNYFSASFIESWIRENNGHFVKTVWFITLTVSIVLSICFLILQYNQSILHIRVLSEYNRYYFCHKKITNLFCVLNAIICVVILSLDYLFVTLINNNFGMIQYIIILNMTSVLLLLVPSFILSCVRIRSKLKTSVLSNLD